MKRLFIALCVSFLCSSAFSLENMDIYVQTGYNFGFFFEKGQYSADTECKSYFIANGFDLSPSVIFKNNVGIFSHMQFYFPGTLKTDIHNIGKKTEIKGKNIRNVVDFSFSLGPCYRFTFDSFEVVAGAGFHLTYFSKETKTKDSITLVAFGAAGDVGGKFFVSRNFYITFGSVFSYDFYANATKSLADDDVVSKLSGAYSFFNVKPYLGIGLNVGNLF